MSLVSHLEEFRKRLVACIICFFAAVLLCLGQAAWLTERLMEKAQGFQFVYIAPTELVLSYVRLALTGGRVTGMPGDALSDLGIYQAGADAQGTAVLLCDSDLWNAAFFNRGGICL